MRNDLAAWITGLAALGLTAGCTTSSERADRNQLTAHVGKYDPAPAGLKKTKVGVPQFKVDPNVPQDNVKKEKVGEEASDILTTLWTKSKRFQVVERGQLGQLLKEQGLEGIVDPEEMAQPGRVKGVDYLCIGKVTEMRVKAEKTASSFSLGSILPGAGVFDYNNEKSTVTVECGVHIRLVNPTTGVTLSAGKGHYKRTDSIGATGVTILGVGGRSQADMQIDEDSRGLLLELALDDAVRDMLKDTDEALLENQKPEDGEPPKDPTPTAKKCAGCSKDLPADAKECPGCGAKVPE